MHLQFSDSSIQPISIEYTPTYMCVELHGRRLGNYILMRVRLILFLSPRDRCVPKRNMHWLRSMVKLGWLLYSMISMHLAINVVECARFYMITIIENFISLQVSIICAFHFVCVKTMLTYFPNIFYEQTNESNRNLFENRNVTFYHIWL